MDLALDERGRVACALNRWLTYETTWTSGFVARGGFRERELDDLLRDLVSAHSAKKRRSKSAYSRGKTFWASASAAFDPRCVLEALALETFRRATREAMRKSEESGGEEDARLTYDPETSGAEWWTQVIDDEDEIGWHWDKDYALEGSGVNVHPQLGTVTYFCDGGAPTVVVDRPTEVEYDGDSGDVGVCGDISSCSISWPEWGKQITFDGKLLHGAPSEFSRTPTQSRKRITFLVNVWLNHKPLTAEQLSEEELDVMKLRDVARMESFVSSSATVKTEPSFAFVDAGVEPFVFKFTYAERKRTLTLGLRRCLEKDPSSASTSHEIGACGMQTWCSRAEASLGVLR